MKTYKWEIKEEILNDESSDETTEITHTVALSCSLTFGKAVITIDGDEYDISVKPFALRGTNQVFRLGELPAVVEFPKKGAPTVTVNGEIIPALS